MLNHVEGLMLKIARDMRDGQPVRQGSDRFFLWWIVHNAAHRPNLKSGHCPGGRGQDRRYSSQPAVDPPIPGHEVATVNRQDDTRNGRGVGPGEKSDRIRDFFCLDKTPEGRAGCQPVP